MEYKPGMSNLFGASQGNAKPQGSARPDIIKDGYEILMMQRAVANALGEMARYQYQSAIESFGIRISDRRQPKKPVDVVS